MPIHVGGIRGTVCIRLDMFPFFTKGVLTNPTLGTAPEDIDEIFPPRKLPDASSNLDSTSNVTGPVATGTGFFTPEPSAGLRKPQSGGKRDNRVLRMELPTGSAYVPLMLVSCQQPKSR